MRCVREKASEQDSQRTLNDSVKKVMVSLV